MAALLASAVAGALVGASLGGPYALAAGVAVVQALLLLGLTRTADVPAGRTSAVVALAAGLGATAAIATTAEGPFDIATLTPVLVALGAGFVAMIVVQLARRDGRERLTASLSFGVTGLLLVGAAAGWLALGDDDVGVAVLLLALVGTAVGAAIMIFPGPAALWIIGGTVAGASAGLIIQAYASPVEDATLEPLTASLVSGACGLAATVGVWVARLLRDERGQDADIAPSRIDHALLAATLPVVLAAPVAVSAAWAFGEGLLTRG